MCDSWHQAFDLLHGAVGSVYPGAVLLVAGPEHGIHLEAVGNTATAGHGIEPAPVTAQTVFDLASLTKPLVTTSLLAVLAGKGKVDLDDPISRYLPETRGFATADLTSRQLLAHASGLPPWLPFAGDLHRAHGSTIAGTDRARDTVLGSVISQPLESEPGNHTRYSDLGFILLGRLVETITGQTLDRAFEGLIASRLGLKDTFFVPVVRGSSGPCPVPPDRVAATERCPTRGRVLHGEVHDDNAWILGGVAGHAGLFGTAEEILTVCSAWLAAWSGRSDDLFPTEVVRTLWKKEEAPGDSTWTLGFDTPTPGTSSAGHDHPGSLVGHLGFTGTSLWLAPETGVSVILLTNRVHPDRENEAIKGFRPRLHDAIWAALGIGTVGTD